jgi:hypothetical protein
MLARSAESRAKRIGGNGNMSDFQYTMVPGKLKDVFGKLRETGRPPRVNLTWLASLGFKSSNDRGLLRVLKFIHFVDDSDTPTSLWTQYRGVNHKKVLAEAIRQGYAELFTMYPNAWARSNTELEHFFSTRTSAGKQVIDKTIATFKALCELADFADLAPISASEASILQDSDAQEVSVGRIDRTGAQEVFRGLGTGVTININIQLTLPDTSDVTVYDSFFAALKKHLMPPDNVDKND